jgi:cytochrome c oxidase subunit I+III
VQRLPSSSFVPLLAALAIGGFFLFGTFHWWRLALGSTVVGIGLILYWLWGTAQIPEKAMKVVGAGKSLPLYASGSSAIGWMGLFVTMLADLTAWVSLIFGYFFFWTVHEDFPPTPFPGPGVFWPTMGAALLVLAWGLVCLSRRANNRDHAGLFYGSTLAAFALSALGSAALIAGPVRASLDPTHHVYGAIVWVLLAWLVFHVAVGMIMLVYVAARRLAKKMDARHDADLRNIALYWHFTTLTVVVTTLVIAGFPLVR